jgi:hypothetical protein
MTHRLPPSTSPFIEADDVLCAPSQIRGFQLEGYPALDAHEGSRISLRYTENGHITKPIPEKPTFGSVSVYGTASPFNNDTLRGIHHVWNRNGTGGDRRGVLLNRQSFDDGSCYEANDSYLSKARQLKHQRPHDGLDGANLACSVEVVLPGSIQKATGYTLYWVWDWPSIGESAETLYVKKDEVYTTCVDIGII